MRVLVTGGAGFIGSAIGDLCVEQGHEVAVLDNLSSGKRAYAPPRARFYELDLNGELDPLFEEFRPEAVVHQAAHACVAASFGKPVFDATQNILGSINLLEACRRHGVKRFIYASSSAVYGRENTLPSREAQTPRPISPYGVSKLVVEHYLRCYALEHGIRSVALRYANVYGPRQDPHGETGVVAVFAARILSGQPSTLYGDGLQTRDFIYVGDVAAANLAALEKDPQGPYPVILNVSGNSRKSIQEILDLLCLAANVNTVPNREQSRPGDVRHAQLDNSAIRELLSWTPKVPLEEGLRRTLDFVRRNPER